MFVNWVEFVVIPQLDFSPGRQPRLILDNASIHHTQELKDMCALRGVELDYLPPYSPDMNPIEKTFSVLKKWFKRNYRLAETFENVGLFMLYALREIHMSDIAVALIREAGYLKE
jgi:transposase